MAETYLETHTPNLADVTQKLVTEVDAMYLSAQGGPMVPRSRLQRLNNKIDNLIYGVNARLFADTRLYGTIPPHVFIIPGKQMKEWASANWGGNYPDYYSTPQSNGSMALYVSEGIRTLTISPKFHTVKWFFKYMLSLPDNKPARYELSVSRFLNEWEHGKKGEFWRIIREHGFNLDMLQNINRVWDKKEDKEAEVEDLQWIHQLARYAIPPHLEIS